MLKSLTVEPVALHGFVSEEQTEGKIAVNGDRYQGIVRNEDNFSLQLQSADGAFRFLSKADLQSIDRSQGSMMPSDYASRLSEAQLNDLVSYLLSLEKTSLPIATRHADDE